MLQHRCMWCIWHLEGLGLYPHARLNSILCYINKCLRCLKLTHKSPEINLPNRIVEDPSLSVYCKSYSHHFNFICAKQLLGTEYNLKCSCYIRYIHHISDMEYYLESLPPSLPPSVIRWVGDKIEQTEDIEAIAGNYQPQARSIQGHGCWHSCNSP